MKASLLWIDLRNVQKNIVEAEHVEHNTCWKHFFYNMYDIIVCKIYMLKRSYFVKNILWKCIMLWNCCEKMTLWKHLSLQKLHRENLMFWAKYTVKAYSLCGKYIMKAYSIYGKYILKAYSIYGKYILKAYSICGKYILKAYSLSGKYIVKAY